MFVYFNVHLVSDSTGETLNAIMRAAVAQFEQIMPLEHNYYLVRSERQLARVIREIEAAPGVVWFTISDETLRGQLETYCRQNGHPLLAVLDSSVSMLSRHLGLSATERIAGQHTMNDDYFERIDAINYTLAHDDGQGLGGIHNADVVLVGVSRTSKTPTCVYLANRGVKAANVPLVPGIPAPVELTDLTGPSAPLVIGLRISPDRLLQIRRQRLISMKDDGQSDYADDETVRREVTEANRLFARHKWPTVEVSRRSVEETAAAILNKLKEHRS